MKTALFSLARALPIVAAIGISAAVVCAPAVAARAVPAHVGGAWHGGAGHWHGGYGHYGHYGHYGYGYWPYWGAVGLGIGIGAIGYYGGYYGGYYRGYYPYYDAYYYDPPLVVAPQYTTVDPGAQHTGQPVPQASTAPEPIFYPRNGQSAEATESDRRECNRWATTQNGAMGDASIFQRATFACMEGRGYTVR